MAGMDVVARQQFERLATRPEARDEVDFLAAGEEVIPVFHAGTLYAGRILELFPVLDLIDDPHDLESRHHEDFRDILDRPLLIDAQIPYRQVPADEQGVARLRAAGAQPFRWAAGRRAIAIAAGDLLNGFARHVDTNHDFALWPEATYLMGSSAGNVREMSQIG